MTWTIGTPVQEAVVAAAVALADGGYLAIFTGPKPNGADLSETGTFLVQIDLNTPAFNPDGSINTTPPLTGVGTNPGTAGWGRIIDAVDGDGLFDGTVGEEFMLDFTHIEAGGVVNITGGYIYINDGTV